MERVSTATPTQPAAPVRQLPESPHYVVDDPSVLPYQHLAHIGQGGSGIVDKVQHKQTRLLYARKTIKIPISNAKKLRKASEEFKQETETLRRLRHHHIIRVVASYSTRDSFSIILEPLAEGGNLKTFLDLFLATEDQAHRAQMEPTIIRASGCLASGLEFMHRLKIRHRDIKPENILLHCGSPVYADFGIARDYSDRSQSATEFNPGAYTPRYCAPEVLAWDLRTWRSDVFSLGCVFILLYTALFPTPIMKNLTGPFCQHLDQIDIALRHFDREKEMVDAMRHMLKRQEEERASAKMIVEILANCPNKYYCISCQESLPSANHAQREGSKLLRSDNYGIREPARRLPENPSAQETAALRNSDSSPDASYYDSLSSSDSGKYVGEASQISTEHVTCPHSHPELEMPGRVSKHEVEHKVTHPLADVPWQPPATAPSLQMKTRPQRNDSLVSGFGKTLFSPPSYEDGLSGVTVASQLVQVSRLPKLGLQRYTTVRILQPIIQHTKRSGISQAEEREQVLFEENAYEWASFYLGFGVRLRKRTPCGGILPSLSIYPVVDSSDPLWHEFERSSIIDIQRAITKGKLHPYMEDEIGGNLLDAAIFTERLDVCRLLLSYGVRPRPGFFNSFVLRYVAGILRPISPIDLLRFVFSSMSFAPEFESLEATWKILWTPDITAWLFHNAGEYGVDMRAIEELCLRITLRQLSDYLPADPERARELLLMYLTPHLVERIRNQDIILLDDVFFPYTSYEYNAELFEELHIGEVRWDIGALWLSTLAERGIDIPAYVGYEVRVHPDRMLEDPGKSNDRIIFFESSKRGYVLGWLYDTEYEPCELVLDEFFSLALLGQTGEWPFAEERAANDAERPGSRMPGEWVSVDL